MEDVPGMLLWQSKDTSLRECEAWGDPNPCFTCLGCAGEYCTLEARVENCIEAVLSDYETAAAVTSSYLSLKPSFAMRRHMQLGHSTPSKPIWLVNISFAN